MNGYAIFPQRWQTFNLCFLNRTVASLSPEEDALAYARENKCNVRVYDRNWFDVMYIEYHAATDTAVVQRTRRLFT